MGVGGSIGRLIGDILGLIVGISCFVVGAVVLSQMNSSTLFTSTGTTGEHTAAINVISQFGPIGTIVGACFVIVFLSDMVNTVRTMAGGSGSN